MNLQLQAEFNQAVKNIGETGEQYAKAKSLSWKLQEMRGVVLAKLIKMDLPVSKGELLAKSSEEYEAFIGNVAVAIHEELLSKARYETAKAEFEKLRSLCSLEKATIKEIG